ncbi:MAG: PQQ-dependent sugar dehydrogenase [Alphaproteobacteria bacterium]|nr:PQQ-dependent sugar dehydrogenase [Alphaproteobacteria bacterium]
MTPIGPMTHRLARRAACTTLTAAVLVTLGCAAAPVQDAAPAEDKVYRSQQAAFRLKAIASGLENPWALAFLPGGDMLVTERPGRLRLIRDGKLVKAPIAGVPPVVERGQGGLLDVVTHPKFAENRLIYLTYAGRRMDGIGTHVARARFTGDRLEDLKVIFAARPGGSGGVHFGSRIVFGADGLMYITTGERGEPENAQKLTTLIGKVIRLTDDGKVPPGNPFVNRAGTQPEIFTYGHRNAQGIARHPGTGAIWAVEHGARGGDEINILKRGANYGWPVITYGMSYAGFPIGEGTHKPGMEQPIKYWVPSIAPSGMAFYTGDKFPGWKGNLFVGALALQHLNRLTLDGEHVVGEERLLEDWHQRIRDVRNGPDGYLYILTDEDPGAVVRLEPVP